MDVIDLQNYTLKAVEEITSGQILYDNQYAQGTEEGKKSEIHLRQPMHIIPILFSFGKFRGRPTPVGSL